MLSNKRILITGANGGIGFSIAELFLQNNAKLVLFYHKNNNRISKLLKTFSDIDAYQVDLLDNSKIESALSNALKKGNIEGFVHCVSTPLTMKNWNDLSWKDFQLQIDLQVQSFFQIIKYLISSMKEGKFGRVVSILSTGVIGKPPSNMSDYIVGKYALEGLSKSLAVELGRFNITVNCISPSMVDTDLVKNLPSKYKEIAKSQAPTGRLTTPDDVASVALSLCSNQAGYVTGENILISGGQTIQ